MRTMLEPGACRPKRRKAAIARKLGIAKASVYRMMKDGHTCSPRSYLPRSRRTLWTLFSSATVLVFLLLVASRSPRVMLAKFSRIGVLGGGF